MVRLLGYFANQSDRLKCAVALDAPTLALSAGGVSAGWGVGAYSQGEVLLRRNPAETREMPALADALAGVRTDCAIVHVGTVAPVRRTLENTEPFRFRQWMFAARGTVADGATAARLRATVPDFLARNIRGESPDEVLFYTWLGVIQESGRLDDDQVDGDVIGTSLTEAVARLDACASESGSDRPAFALVATNHTAFGAVQHGVPLHWTRRAGVRDCVACRRTPDVSGREPRRMNHEQLRYVLVADVADPPGASWFALEGPRGAVLTVDRALETRVQEL